MAKTSFRAHAIQRMAQRRISMNEVRHILGHGEVIEDYPTDTPYPSRLILGHVSNRPLHVVAAYNAVEDETIVITTYEPGPTLWDGSFKKRA